MSSLVRGFSVESNKWVRGELSSDQNRREV